MGRKYIIKTVDSPSFQIAQRFEDLITKGKLKPGAWLLSTRQLADELAVDREIIRKAYSILKDRGLVEVVPNIGTRVVKKMKSAKKSADLPLGEAVEEVLRRSDLGSGSRPATSFAPPDARKPSKRRPRKSSKKGKKKSAGKKSAKPARKTAHDKADD